MEMKSLGPSFIHNPYTGLDLSLTKRSEWVFMSVQGPTVFKKTLLLSLYLHMSLSAHVGPFVLIHACIPDITIQKEPPFKHHIL